MSKKGKAKFYLYESQLVRIDNNDSNICCWEAPKKRKDGFWFIPSWSDGIYLVVHSKPITEEEAIAYTIEGYKIIKREVNKEFALNKLYEQPKTGK